MDKKQLRSMLLLTAVVFSLAVFTTPLKAQITFFYIVNTTSDTVVANACVNAAAGCSLRGAIEAANSTGASTIQIAIPASDPFCAAGACTINISSILPTITVNTEIDGPGADKLTLKPVTGGQFSVFRVTNVGPVIFFGITISNGVTVSTSGGGIVNSSKGGTLTLINCTVRDNQVTGSGGGGGILNGAFSTLNVVNSTISGNKTAATGAAGGGIANFGTMNITNTTISGNQVGARACGGGGIANANNTQTNITNSTISGNVSLGGAGGVCSGSNSTTNVKNSIIALNIANSTGPDVNGNVVSAGFNLIGKTDGSAGFTVSTDLTGTIASPLNPGLDEGGLQDNGGPTKTIALSINSPAVDKGTSNSLTGALTTDQRGSGFARTLDKSAIANALGGDGTDIGAFELGTAIGGVVTYGNAVGAPMPRFVSSVMITANGMPTIITTTGAPGVAAGQYSLTGFGAGSYTITPTKTGSVNGISSFDAAKIAQHVSGSSTLTGNALLVADVSGNGIVSSFDAAQIAAFVSSGSGMLTGTWKFVPANRPYSSVTSDLTNEDYTALLMGEVSGNWTNTGARSAKVFDPNALAWLLSGPY